MTEFVQRDLTGATFDHVDLTRATFRSCDLTGAVMRGVDLVDVDIQADVENLVINGVDVAPLITAELDRRQPGRAKMRPTDPAGFREGYDLVLGLWDETVARARRLDPALLHESVDGEWSFVETLRHLAFATDSWVGRAVQGDPSPWHPLDLPWDEMPDTPGVPRDRAVRPSLDEVLALRRDRTDMVRRYLADLTEAELDRDTDEHRTPGWPLRSFPVRQCLLIVLNEEWEHRRYAERDLAVLEAGQS
jgi:uncharacterized protein YjbI with pentapeptide repeats